MSWRSFFWRELFFKFLTARRIGKYQIGFEDWISDNLIRVRELGNYKKKDQGSRMYKKNNYFRICVYVCVSMCISLYVSMYLCRCVCVCMCKCRCVCVCISVCVRERMCIVVRVGVYVYRCWCVWGFCDNLIRVRGLRN